jgi:enamine deaminase RidA (YjgF/YER057c/UK114 family)
MPKQFINPPGLSNPGTYTHVVRVQGSKLVFISGQVALDASGNFVGAGDLRAQAKQTLENLKTALAAASATLSDVIKLNIYVVNYRPEDRQVIGEIRGQYFAAAHPPASTLVGVQALARPEFMIEIEAVAAVE